MNIYQTHYCAGCTRELVRQIPTTANDDFDPYALDYPAAGEESFCSPKCKINFTTKGQES